MFVRHVPAVAGASLVGLAAMWTGNRWVVLLGALVAWALLGRVALGAMPPVRSALASGVVAACIVAIADTMLAQSGALFHLRPEVPGAPVAIGVEAVRGALLAVSLFAYVTVREKSGVAASSLTAGVVALAAGIAFEGVGSRVGLWHWNEFGVPAGSGMVPMFAVGAWVVSGALAGYHLREPQCSIPSAVIPVLSGLRSGTTFAASLLVLWAALIRWSGRALSL